MTTEIAQADLVTIKRRFIFRIVLLVLTLALWKGWAEENHYLDDQLWKENQILQGSNSPGSFNQHVVDVTEKENRYQEREKGQPWKLVPMVLWSVFAGWLATAPKAKSRIDNGLTAIAAQPKLMTAIIAGFCAIMGGWMICGHANTGAFTGLVVGGYVWWLGRKVGQQEPEGVPKK